VTRLRAVLGSAFFVLFGGPTIVAGLVPWLLTRWEADDPPLALRLAGTVLLCVGAALVLETTARFALQGRGTPAPFAPPERFVARGSYRLTRNPMYVGVLALIAGQALVLGREVLLLWAGVAALMFHLFVVLHEEPDLRKRFGPEYEAYEADVGRWGPRLSRSSDPGRR
jgi:protein-S-isoprenylcysteine O-methyltransferase Ste14